MTKRKIIEIAGSFFVGIPKPFAETINCKKGDSLDVSFRNNTLVYAPLQVVET